MPCTDTNPPAFASEISKFLRSRSGIKSSRAPGAALRWPPAIDAFPAGTIGKWPYSNYSHRGLRFAGPRLIDAFPFRGQSENGHTPIISTKNGRAADG